MDAIGNGDSAYDSKPSMICLQYRREQLDCRDRREVISEAPSMSATAQGEDHCTLRSDDENVTSDTSRGSLTVGNTVHVCKETLATVVLANEAESRFG